MSALEPVPVLAAPGEAVPMYVQRICQQENWDDYLPERARTAAWQLEQGVKRGLDVLLASTLLLLVLPLLLVIMAAIRLTSPGPIFYEWRVLGRRGRPFVGYKFRTMVENADALKPALLTANEMTGPAFKMRADPRVTALGRTLRRYSLDELPQLWSVIKGDMSLVGPRPPSAEEFAQFEPWQRGKLVLTPGLTCLWQVSGRSEIRHFDEWMRLDRAYVRNWSLALDLKILLLTVPAVLRGDGAY